LNSDKIWKVWKKSKFNSEKIWKIWKKSKLNSEKIWKILFFFPIFPIFSLFNLLFFHIFHLISQCSSVLSKSFHYSTYFSSIISIFFTIQLTFLL
jgi:hypothetical protein